MDVALTPPVAGGDPPKAGGPPGLVPGGPGGKGQYPEQGRMEAFPGIGRSAHNKGSGLEL